jgi:hypothetical protein
LRGWTRCGPSSRSRFELACSPWSDLERGNPFVLVRAREYPDPLDSEGTKRVLHMNPHIRFEATLSNRNVGP